ncbi:4-(cytidine 5'-diphospho)-2-C-methyl-D-erythritol kinase [Candidatus Omnitrophota bacterium]
MRTLRLKAPAKINLYLRVVRKRSDGYHNIETIFEKIDLCDQITLTKRKQGIKLICSDQGLPRNGQNLAAVAAAAIFAKSNYRAGIQIRIKKNIPVAAGLGGGSSDAASVLLGLNKLLNLKQTRRSLLALAEQIGADVPFFILRDIRALGLGKGERLKALSIKRNNWYILVMPGGVSVSTGRMYQKLRIALTKRPSSAKIVIRALQEGNLTALNKYSYNSFESILLKKYKPVQKIKKALKTFGASATLISGSGPCVFGVAQTRKEAMAISAGLRATRDNSWRIIVTKTLSNSEKED